MTALLLGIVVVCGSAAQQQDTPATPVVEISAGVERRLDRFRYRFENPSTFDMGLVKHFFQQRYSGPRNWFVLRASYRPRRGRPWSGEIGLTPQIVTFGEDMDTFFNPGNNVIVSGTTGDVHMQSFRAAIGFERAGGRIRYTYRRDRSKFLLDQLKIVTTSNPPSRVETLIPIRETTISQVHQFWAGWRARRVVSPRWQIHGEIDLSPSTLARLNTILPVKYPGRDIVFWAVGFELAGRVTIVRDGRWPIAASADLGRTFPYRPSARFTRDALGVSVAVGVAR